MPKTLLKGRAFHANKAMQRHPNGVDRVTLQIVVGPLSYGHGAACHVASPDQREQGIRSTFRDYWAATWLKCRTVAQAARRSATPRRDRQKIGPALLPIRADLSEGVAELKPQNQCMLAAVGAITYRRVAGRSSSAYGPVHRNRLVARRGQRLARGCLSRSPEPAGAWCQSKPAN